MLAAIIIIINFYIMQKLKHSIHIPDRLIQQILLFNWNLTSVFPSLHISKRLIYLTNSGDVYWIYALECTMHFGEYSLFPQEIFP